MKKLKLKGTYYEMGLQMGEILKDTVGYPPKFSKEVQIAESKLRPLIEQKNWEEFMRILLKS